METNTELQKQASLYTHTHTFPYLTQQLRSGRSGAKSVLNTDMVNYVYTQKSPAQIQSPTLVSALPPRRLLSPSSILPPPSSHCAFIPTRKNSAHVIFFFFLLLLKLSESASVGGLSQSLRKNNVLLGG